MIDFSIIIPVYNAEKTLERCLASINEQTYSNYEVILIDDGSLDESLNICKRYELQDQRYRVFHQANSGPSVARNVGLDIAIGKWICFVDSDDSIEATYLQDIWHATQEDDVDVIFIGYHKVCKNIVQESMLPCEVFDTNMETILNLSEHDMFGYTWIKSFQREAIKDIRFDPTLNLFEDEVFSCEVILNCERIGVVRKPIYNYNVGEETSLIGRTHEDYCFKCDKVYNAWKTMLKGNQDFEQYVIKIANNFVARCYYYAFERPVDIETYFAQLRGTAFFQEHTDLNLYDEAVRQYNYKKLRFAKIKYRAKVWIASTIHRKG